MEDSTLQRLLSFAKARGVKCRKVSDDRLHALGLEGAVEEAPFCPFLGINWKSKELYYTSHATWMEMIHELGHILACEKPPKGSNEWGFFGWELAVVHKIRGNLSDWIENNKDYGTADGLELGTLDPVALHEMLAERIKHAQSVDLVDDQGLPLVVR